MLLSFSFSFSLSLSTHHTDTSAAFWVAWEISPCYTHIQTHDHKRAAEVKRRLGVWIPVGLPTDVQYINNTLLSHVGTCLAVDLDSLVAQFDGVIVSAFRVLVYPQFCPLDETKTRRGQTTYYRHRPLPSCLGPSWCVETWRPGWRAGWRVGQRDPQDLSSACRGTASGSGPGRPRASTSRLEDVRRELRPLCNGCRLVSEAEGSYHGRRSWQPGTGLCMLREPLD